MSQHWKRLAALACALVLVASACGRDSDDDSSDDSGGETAEGAFINPSEDCDDYQATAGVEGDTLKIGTIRPADGPYAIYDQVTTGLQAWVDSTNDNGGIEAGDGNTYQLELLKENDGYDPGRTLGLAQKLVEQEGVFALVGVIGTENNLAIRDYLNDACVPNISLATGSPEWGKANDYPWYISALPSYATEASMWVDYLKETNPEASIALLYQDDDFGNAYKNALETQIEGTDIEIVDQQSYNPLSGGTTEAATVALSQSGADTFVIGIGGSPCPATLTFMPDTWTPETFISTTCTGATALSLAGGRDVGIVAAQAVYDVTDPADADQQVVQDFLTNGAAAGLDEQQLTGGISSVGWGFGALFGLGIEGADAVERAEVMNTLFSLDGVSTGLVRAEMDVSTDGAEDPWPLEGFRMVERTADGWSELSPFKNKNGESNAIADQ